MEKTKIAGVFAHPDDETFVGASIFYEAAVRGKEVVLFVATRGEAGKSGRLGAMTREQLAERRKLELRAALDIIKINTFHQLTYPDGKLSQVDREQLIQDVATFINEQHAQVIVTFPEDGISGHPDHTAIHHAVREAVVSEKCPEVQKLYYAASRPLLHAGHSPSIVFDSNVHREIKVQALLAHESQILSIERVFGDLHHPQTKIRPESFVLAWQRGIYWPDKKEGFFTDDLACV
ncbi:PIG-L deacetylase family protein [Aneurinibacillus terranovensis]|uniref:PIG-L deacetylase family protein n=1 Tax=Aneurinibacillus terranovensis TaxID=278991 RepID=UPI00041357AC|nr:PIG-L family deacetylase [Aneurinibacillus terranovensis]